MNKELNKLVIEYKKTKKQYILNDIFKMLEKLIKDKAEYLFYQKTFKNGKYYFKLCDTKKVELDDIIQELNIEVLRIINLYDITKSFSKYLFSCLWNWRPEFIRKKQFRQELKNKNESEFENKQGMSYFENIISECQEEIEEPVNIVDKFENLTKKEKLLIKLILHNPHLNQSQIAGMMRVTQQQVSKLLHNLRKKYKKEG